MSDQPIDVYAKALLETKTAKVGGVVVSLTPESVFRPEDESWTHRIFVGPNWKPGILTPRYELRTDPTLNAKPLQVRDISLKWKYSTDVSKWSAGIYRTGFIFPGFCCKCFKPAVKHKLVELQVPAKGSTSGKQEILNVDADTGARMWSAILTNRYWYAIPFCEEHDLASRAIDYWITDGGKIGLKFTNEKYGKLASELNKLSGSWLTQSILFKTRILAILGMYVGFAITFWGALKTYVGFKGSLGVTVSGPYDKPLGLLIAACGLSIGIWSLIYFLKNRKGEQHKIEKH